MQLYLLAIICVVLVILAVVLNAVRQREVAKLEALARQGPVGGWGYIPPGGYLPGPPYKRGKPDVVLDEFVEETVAKLQAAEEMAAAIEGLLAIPWVGSWQCVQAVQLKRALEAWKEANGERQ